MNAQTEQTDNDILARAMLVNIRISTWEARKHDKKVTAQINDEHHASSDAGRYHKHLFGGKVPSHSAVLNAAINARDLHYAETLPWSDTGWRLLPTDNYFQYTQQLREAKAVFEQKLEEFLVDYPTLRAEAKDRLQGMYREQDYPTVGQVRNKFSFRVEYEPLPSGGDFRVSLPAEELERVKQDVEERVSRSTQMAMEEAWSRLGDAVAALNKRLSDGKYLRETMVQRITEVGEALGRMNILGDPQLEELRTQAMADLGSLDVEHLRENDGDRLEANEKANNILNAMKGMYG